METLGNKIMPKLCSGFYCDNCHYNTSKKSSYINHTLSAKHQKSIKVNILETNGNQIMPKLCSTKYSCENCNKEFKNRSGLWKHKQKCKTKTNNDVKCVELNEKDLILMLINDNKELRNLLLEQTKEKDEFKNMMLKVIENGTNNNSNNIHTNSHNKAFNLNFFLNETCKDAMNITDFVESIKLQLTDLEKVGELGYVEGLSNIIARNLKELDITQRPVHCTDKKRETMYVKDENIWEKDEERKKMHKLVKKITDKNIKLLPEYRELHPDYINASSLRSDQYNQIFLQALGGSGDNDYEKEEKIIQKVSREVLVEKNNS